MTSDTLPLRGRLWPRERRAYLESRRYPGDAGWNRPEPATADAVWKLVAESLRLSLSSLLPTEDWFARLDSDEIDAAVTTAQRALAVAIDTAIQAGENGRLLTQNLLFDALASRWSEHYRATVENTATTCSYEMRSETLRAAWRELLRTDIRFVALWKVARRGAKGLYATTRVPKSGYKVDLEKGSPLLDEFLRIVNADREYRRNGRRTRLVRAQEPFADRRERCDVTAEWAFNTVTVGARSLELMDRLEAARLWLDANAVAQYVDTLEDRVKNAGDVAQREAADAERGQYGRIREEINDLKSTDGIDVDTAGQVWYKVKTRVFKAINRRFHAENFWPSEVTGKDLRPEKIYESESDEIWATASTRGRWFWAPSRHPLVGVDVSTSQYQILAVFLGLKELEEALHERSLKDVFTARARERDASRRDRFRLPKGFRPDDTRLTAAIKTALLTFGYGADPHNIARNLRKSPADYGPGLGDAANIEALLAGDVLLAEIFNKWKPACKELATRADKYKGLILTDPFDRAKVRWNPVRIEDTPCAGDGDTVKIRANLPVMARRAKSRGGVEWVPAIPNPTGDYPIDRAALGRMVGPCIVHMLDALFAGIVVEKLNAIGVQDIVSIHDAWLIPEDAEPALRKAVDAAGEPWLRALKPVYDDLVRYLGPTKQYGDWIREKRDIRQRRIKAGKWPAFRVERQIIFEPHALTAGK